MLTLWPTWVIRSKLCKIPHLVLNQEPAVIRFVVSGYFLYRQQPQVWTRHRGGANDLILELEEQTTMRAVSCLLTLELKG